MQHFGATLEVKGGPRYFHLLLLASLVAAEARVPSGAHENMIKHLCTTSTLSDHLAKHGKHVLHTHNTRETEPKKQSRGKWANREHGAHPHPSGCPRVATRGVTGDITSDVRVPVATRGMVWPATRRAG